jgi:hypothetical protein
LNNMLKYLFLAIGLLINLSLMAQDPSSQAVEMADALRQSGKIYVVIACIVLIFVGLLLFLFRIDKKIKTLEENKP